MTGRNALTADARPTAVRLTPGGRGAVATVRFDGDPGLVDAADLFHAANGRALAEQPLGRIVYGRWGRGAADDPAEDIVVCRTAERQAEIHCHGGEAAVGRILRDLETAGCRVETWRGAARRANVFEAECAEALSRASTGRTAGLLIEQQGGLLRSALEAILGLLTDAHRPADAGAQTIPPEAARREALQRIDAMLAWADFGLHLSQPWRVVVAGRPNVGKSSLINALLGYSRAIVYDRPGTTRDIVTAEAAFDGWPVQLADTAGIREGGGALESAGIDRARNLLREADCRMLLIDVSRPPGDDDRRLLGEWPDALRVAHKVDLPDQWGAAIPDDALRVSSVTGAGVEALAGAIVGRLVPRVPEAGTPVPIARRQVELLRRAREAVVGEDISAACAALEECLG